ncbi:MAG: LiaF transmembrane domain-containing protein [Steroidobacteraceae bacterium]
MNAEFPARRGGASHSLGLVLAGLVVIAFGLALLADNVGWFSLHYVLAQLWPLGLIVLGIALLLQRRAGQGHGFWGIVLIAGGAWELARQQHWTQVSFWSVFGPVLIVLAGGSLIWRALHRPRPAALSASYIRTSAILSGSEWRPTTPFEGADVNATLGGIKLDLTGTPMLGDSATIDVFVLMGGVEVLVPRDWTVTNQMVTFMGGCHDKRHPSSLPPAKQLILRGFNMMGGIEIKD